MTDSVLNQPHPRNAPFQRQRAQSEIWIPIPIDTTCFCGDPIVANLSNSSFKFLYSSMVWVSIFFCFRTVTAFSIPLYRFVIQHVQKTIHTNN